MSDWFIVITLILYSLGFLKGVAFEDNDITPRRNMLTPVRKAKLASPDAQSAIPLPETKT